MSKAKKESEVVYLEQVSRDYRIMLLIATMEYVSQTRTHTLSKDTPP